MNWRHTFSHITKFFVWLLLSVPISFKILGIGAVVAFLFGAVTLYQIQASLTRYLYENLKQNTYSMARSLSEVLTNPLIVDDIFSVHQILRNKIETSPDVRYLIIQDERGRVVAHTFGATVPEDLLQVSSNGYRTSSSQEKLQIFKTSSALIFDVTMPIQYGKAGILRVGVSDEKIQEVMSSITRAFLWALGTCIVLGQALAILLTHILTRPINHLVMASNYIRKGEFETRAKVFSADEIGKLAVAFNQMVEGLERYKAEVKKKELERLFLIKRIVTAQEEERKNIARELHDQLGQYLSTLLLMIQSMDKDRDFPADHREEIEKKIRALIDEVGKLAFELRPAVLDDYGLDSALRRYFSETMKYSQTKIDYQYISPVESMRLPSLLETTLYRITQEAVTNALRHANANAVSVILMHRDNEVTLLIEDDGVGFDAAILQKESKDCLGLIGMRERATLLGGDFFIESAPGKGTAIRVKIPVKNQGN